MHKRGALELSVNALVVVILAFAMLGAGLYFTRFVQDKLISESGKIFDINALKEQPTAENPITFPDSLEIKYNGKEEVDVGYYNKNPFEAKKATFIVRADGCVGTTKVPVITSASADVPASSAKGFKLIIREQGAASGESYICTVEVVNADDPGMVYDSKQFFLKVTS